MVLFETSTLHKPLFLLFSATCAELPIELDLSATFANELLTIWTRMVLVQFEKLPTKTLFSCHDDFEND